MKLLLGMLIGLTAQALTFLQLQGRWKFEWMKTHQWAVVLLGIPISILFMTSASTDLEFINPETKLRAFLKDFA